MSLENLVRIGSIKSEPFDAGEFQGLVTAGINRLKDAENTTLSPESRFTLAYDASHSFSLAALRRTGYRPANNRYIVFQCLQNTLGLGPEVWRVLNDGHRRRNAAEYEGDWEASESVVKDLVMATKSVLAALEALPPPEGS
ncbi:MAG: hypothetical protein QM612_04415 [Thermomonas sp.]|uniref:hypothetical protein n=1 Tax=Thermomonas sp. TaxID=1971895 RepID=UPI0039E67E0A